MGHILDRLVQNLRETLGFGIRDLLRFAQLD